MSVHNKRTTYNEIAGRNANRIEALSDGVFSIAMTLLVLDLKIPAQALINSEQQAWQALGKLAPSFLSYALGFMTLGIFWVGQTTQFSFIKRSNRVFSWIHIFFLLTVSLIPFTTSFLSAHIKFRMAIELYFINILLAGIALYIALQYAVRQNLLKLSPDNPEEATTIHALSRRMVTAQIFYAIGASLCFINNYLSIGFIMLVQLNYALGLTSKLR